MPETKELVRKLQQNPRDRVVLKAVKRQMLQERRYKGLGQVMEWWAKKAPSPSEAAQELYEAALTIEKRTQEEARAVELYNLALEYDPSHNAARLRLQRLTRDEEFDALLDALDSTPPPRSSAPAPRVPVDSLAPAAPARPRPPSAPAAASPGFGRPSVRPPGRTSPVPTRPPRASVPPPSTAATRRPASPRASLPAPPAPVPMGPSGPGRPASTGVQPSIASRPAPTFDAVIEEPPAAVPMQAPESGPALPPTAGVSLPVTPSMDEEEETSFYVGALRPAAPSANGSGDGGQPAQAVPLDGFVPALYGDDEEEDEDAPARFALGEILTNGSPHSAGNRRLRCRLEVVGLRGHTVLAAKHIRYFGDAGSTALRARRSGLGRFTVTLAQGVVGVVQRGSGVPAEQVVGPARIQLSRGDRAELNIDGVTHRLTTVGLGEPPPVARQQLHLGRYASAAAVALLLHGLGVGALLLMHSQGVSFVVEDRSREDIFAEARIKPPPEPKKLTKPKPIKLRKKRRPEPKQPTEERAKIPKSLRTKLRRIAKDRTEKNSVDRLVNALKSPVAGDGKSLKEVVSNIDAVAGGEKSGAFKVGGTLAAIKGTGVNIVSGGGGDVGTLGGEQATSKLTRLQASKGKVRGKVRTIKALAKVQGSLSRGEVLKVLNQNQRKIQRCYERALTTKPSLAGKLTYTWTIQPNGKVSSVRQSSSTLGDTGVSKCIGGVIKRMRFPRPKGGPVTVTFPWIFQRAS